MSVPIGVSLFKSAYQLQFHILESAVIETDFERRFWFNIKKYIQTSTVVLQHCLVAVHIFL